MIHETFAIKLESAILQGYEIIKSKFPKTICQAVNDTDLEFHLFSPSSLDIRDIYLQVRPQLVIFHRKIIAPVHYTTFINRLPLLCLFRPCRSKATLHWNNQMDWIRSDWTTCKFFFPFKIIIIIVKLQKKKNFFLKK